MPVNIYFCRGLKHFDILSEVPKGFYLKSFGLLAKMSRDFERDFACFEPDADIFVFLQ